MRRAVRIWGAVLAGGLVLAGCGAQPPYEETGGPVTGGSLPGADPVTAVPLDGTGESQGAAGSEGGGAGAGEPGSDVVTAPGPGGLVERLPNTCQLENYRQYVGQDAVLAARQVRDRPSRIIAPDAIVSQVYDPQRVNFYTDGSGRVARISCG